MLQRSKISRNDASFVAVCLGDASKNEVYQIIILELYLFILHFLPKN